MKKYLLGATENKEIVFGEFGVTNRNGYPEFTASFDLVRPFIGEEYDLTQYYEEWCDEMDKDYLYDLCVRFNCAPSELAEHLADECYDIRDALDCSLYPEVINVNGTDWYFESSSCGQHDTREEMEEYTNKRAYDLLHQLWDEYHLHKVDSNVVVWTQVLESMLDIIDEEAWIKDYISSNF